MITMALKNRFNAKSRSIRPSIGKPMAYGFTFVMNHS